MPAVKKLPRPHPGIWQIGAAYVDDTGGFTLKGWGLGPCISRCQCHHGRDGQQPLALLEDRINGRLGLASFTPSGMCGCCKPWTAIELMAVVEDLESITAMEATDAHD
jgi:hypothetical protein